MNSDAESRAGGAIKLDDLPADWTLIEAIAWIMLRDPAVLRDAAPETMREGGIFYAEHRLPDGRTEMVADTGLPGVTMMRLTMLAACAKHTDPAAQVMMPLEAEAALLAALRAGQLAAHGIPKSGDPRTMEPRDWRGLMLQEEPAGTLIVQPARDIGQRWQNVTVPRAAVVALWPAAGASPTTPQPAPSAPQPKQRNKGGRPEREDWQPFDYEVSRRLALDGDHLTFAAFRRAMREWAAQHTDPVPDDRSIDRRIDARVPRDIFPPS